jgi:hypothetical protein
MTYHFDGHARIEPSRGDGTYKNVDVRFKNTLVWSSNCSTKKRKGDNLHYNAKKVMRFKIFQRAMSKC